MGLEGICLSRGELLCGRKSIALGIRRLGLGVAFFLLPWHSFLAEFLLLSSLTVPFCYWSLGHIFTFSVPSFPWYCEFVPWVSSQLLFILPIWQRGRLRYKAISKEDNGGCDNDLTFSRKLIDLPPKKGARQGKNSFSEKGAQQKGAKLPCTETICM